MTPAPRVAVIVPNFNGADIIEQCLESLFKQTFNNYQVIVVENGSSDGSIAVLRKLKESYSEKLQILENKQNLGFAGGVNTGIRYALRRGFTHVALFNNDAIADKHWLERLSLKVTSGVGTVTGLIVHADGETIDSAGDFYSMWGMAFPSYRDKPTSSAPSDRYVFSGCGGASLYSCQMLREIGLFDERFFAYLEDVDLGFRAQLAGWKAYYTRGAVAFHEQGSTSSKIPGFVVRQSFKNLPMLYIKNVPRGLLWRVGWRFTVLYILSFGNAVLRGNGLSALKGAVLGGWYFWTSALHQRRVIQRRKVVDTAYLEKIIWSGIPPTNRKLRRIKALFSRRRH
jgi:GT2 family glycosyltransferase